MIYLLFYFYFEVKKELEMSKRMCVCVHERKLQQKMENKMNEGYIALCINSSAQFHLRYGGRYVSKR